jgi:hypothetical protein
MRDMDKFRRNVLSLGSSLLAKKATGRHYVKTHKASVPEG